MQSVAAESASISIFVVSLDPSWDGEGEGEGESLTLKVVLDSLRDAGAEGVDKLEIPALLIWNRYGESTWHGVCRVHIWVGVV